MSPKLVDGLTFERLSVAWFGCVLTMVTIGDGVQGYLSARNIVWGVGIAVGAVGVAVVYLLMLLVTGEAIRRTGIEKDMFDERAIAPYIAALVMFAFFWTMSGVVFSQLAVKAGLAEWATVAGWGVGASLAASTIAALLVLIRRGGWHAAFPW